MSDAFNVAAHLPMSRAALPERKPVIKARGARNR